MLMGVGGGPRHHAASGDIIRAMFPRRRVQPNTEQKKAFQELWRKISDNHGNSKCTKLVTVVDTATLKTTISAEIEANFLGTRASFAPAAQTKLGEKALAENRLIYLPSRTSDTIYISGSTDQEFSIHEATFSQLGITRSEIPTNAPALVVTPLIAGQNSGRYGAVIITIDRANKLIPAVHLPVLRMISHDMAYVMLKNDLTL